MPKAQEEQRGFKYKKRTKDDLKERANMRGGNYDSYIKPKFKQWKPKDGKNIIRILPPSWDDARHYGLDIFVNFSIGADNQAYLSLSKHGKGADPIEEARREAQREGDKDFAKKLNPSQRILYWIIDRNDEDEGPLLWAAPFTFDKSLSNLCIDEDTKDVIFIDDPVHGRDVRFYKEGSGLTTKYDPSKMKVLPESTVHEDEGQEEEWLDFISENPLPEVLNFYDYDHIKSTFDGQIGSRDDEEENEQPRARKRSGVDTERTSDKRRPSEEDSGTYTDDDKPAERRTSRGRVRSDDDDDTTPRTRRGAVREASDEEEETTPRRTRRNDDDEAPSRSRSRSKVDEEDEKPRGRQHVASRRHDPDDEPDEEIEDDNPPSTRRTTKPKGDDGEEGNGSLRERLARRRSRSSED